jgi:uncharacterized membrane protein
VYQIEDRPSLDLIYVTMKKTKPWRNMNPLTLLADMQQTYIDNSQMTVSSTPVSPAFFMSMLLIGLLVIVVTYLIRSYFLGRVFKKAGVESWKAWVPIYNYWILNELGDQKGFWAVLSLVPVLNIVAVVYMYIAMYNIGLKFGKDSLFVLFAIFLPLVWVILLAIDSSKWNQPAFVQPPPLAVPVAPVAPNENIPPTL